MPKISWRVVSWSALVVLSLSFGAGPGCGGSRRSRPHRDVLPAPDAAPSQDTAAHLDSRSDSISDSVSPGDWVDRSDGSGAAETSGPRDGGVVDGSADGRDAVGPPRDAQPDAADGRDGGRADLAPDAAQPDAAQPDAAVPSDARDGRDAGLGDTPAGTRDAGDLSLVDAPADGHAPGPADTAGRDGVGRDASPADGPRTDGPADGRADSAGRVDAVESRDIDAGGPRPCLSHEVCDDGDPCNGREHCDFAVQRCARGTPLACETDRCVGLARCEPFVGCRPVAGPEGLPLCYDFDPCNGEETCDPVLAASGDPAACGPGEPLVCDDGRFCNGPETCVAWDGCRPGDPPRCDPGDQADPCDGAWACDEERGCHEVHGPLACDDGDACNGREACVPGEGCRVVEPAPACDDGDPCDGVERCEPATGDCLPGAPPDCDDGNPCTADGCDAAAGGCVFPPVDGACDDGDPCTLDERCVAGACTGGHPTCLCPGDDAWEDDDSPFAATPIALPRDRDAEILHEDQVLCGGEEDWSVVALVAGDWLEVGAQHDPAYGALTLQVEDEAGTVLAQAAGPEAAAGLALEAAADGPVFLGVSGDGAPGFENLYTLRVYQVPAGYCFDDALEPNSHWMYAKPLGWGPGGHPVAPFEGRLCPDDEDWFVTTLAAGETLIADVAFDVADGAVTLDLLDDWGHLLATAAGAPGLQRGTFVAPESADYLLRLRAAPGAAVDYTLTLTVASDPPCVDDLLEDNDTRATAAVVTGPLDLVLCPGDDDWFRLDRSAGEIARGLLTTNPAAAGSLGCELWTDAGLLGPCDAHATGRSFVANEAAGPLYVRVIGPGGAGAAPVPYGLTVRADPPAACPDDAFEVQAAGDDGPPVFPLAAAAPAGRREGTIDLTSCPGDDDTYTVDLAYDEAILADLVFDPTQADLDLRLIGPDGREVRRSQTERGHEQVSYRADGIGAYRLVVPGTTAAAGYTLSVRVDPTSTCAADLFEPNDSRTSPPPPVLEDGMTISGQACPGESDYFAVDLVAGQTLIVDLDAWLLQGDLDLFVYTPTGAVAVASRTLMDGERVVHTAATTGRYAVRVLGLLTGNLYSLGVRVLDGRPPCTDDAAEPNDTLAAARTVPLVADTATVEGALCPYDEDWYAFDLEEGTAVTADVALETGDLGHLDVRCAGPDGVTRGGLTPRSDGAHVFCYARQAGRHTLRIRRTIEAAGQPVAYRLDLVRAAGCSCSAAARVLRAYCGPLDSGGGAGGLDTGQTLSLLLGPTSPAGLVLPSDCSYCGHPPTFEVTEVPEGLRVWWTAFRSYSQYVALDRATPDYDVCFALDRTVIPSPCAHDSAVHPLSGEASGHLCPRTQDIYEVDVPRDRRLAAVHLDFLNADGNLDLIVKNGEYGWVVARAATEQDGEVVEGLGLVGAALVIIEGRTRFDENNYVVRLIFVDR